MINFDAKKRILKKLSAAAEKNALLLLPCLIAAGCVKLFYFIACNIDIALSDSNGNFLGIKSSRKEAALKPKKQDEIVYSRRPLRFRFVSAVLSFAFAMMIVPAAVLTTAFAAFDPNQYKLETEYDFDPPRYYEERLNHIEAPTLITNACVPGDSAFQVAWEWEYPVKLTDDPRVYSFEVYYTSGTDSKQLAGNVKAVNTQSQYEYIIEGLDPKREYTFTVVAKTSIPYYIIEQKYDSDNNPYDSWKKLGSNDWKTVKAESSGYTAEPYAYLTPDPVFTVQYYKTGEQAPGDIPGNDTEQRVILTLLKETDGATGYIVYRKNLDDKNPVELEIGQWKAEELAAGIELGNGRIQKSGKDHTLAPTTLYSYRVVAYKNAFDETYAGEYSNVLDNYFIKSISSKSGTIHTMTAKTSVSAKNDETSITVTWTKVDRATGYYLYRLTDEENTKYLNGELNIEDYLVKKYDDGSKTLSYVDTAADNKVTYWYYVAAYRDYSAGGGSSASEEIGQLAHTSHSLNTTISTPQSVVATPDDGKNIVTWSCLDKKVAGFEIRVTKLTDKEGNDLALKDADGNFILDENGNKTYEYVDVFSVGPTPLKWEHTGLLNGETYQYEIQAFKIINEVKEPVSDFSKPPAVATVGLPFYAPQDITATPGDGQITVEWSKVDRATEYILHIYKITGNYIQEVGTKTLTTNKYVHKNLKNGDKYMYYVIAKKVVNNDPVYTEESEHVTAVVGIPLLAPTDLEAKVTNETVELSWTAVKGADGYYVYVIGDGKTEQYDVTKNKFSHQAKYGVRYTYYVIPYKNIITSDGVQKWTGPSSDTISVVAGILLDAPTNLQAEMKDGEIELTWDKVTGAEGYIVYVMVDGETTTYTVTKNSFLHTGVISGKVYSYFVKAFKTVNGTKIYSLPSSTVSIKAGEYLAAPKDFTVETEDANAILSWTKVAGAEGYIVYAYKSGESYEFDVSKTGYTHTGLTNGDVWHYYVKAYKTVNNGQRVYSEPTTTRTVTIGASLNAPVDLVATAGDRQIDLSWTAVKNAEGYVVYIYNEGSESFVPLTVVSKPGYSHVGLKNGTKYTYMVAAFRTINGERVYGEYSMAVSAIPTSGSAADLDLLLNIKGTSPYGISHSELISAAANHEAFDESVDIYFSVNEESTNAIKNVLKHFANGLKSFIIYPFDISTYYADTLVSVDPNPGYSITITMPIPDKLVKYRDYITVVHIDTGSSNVITEESDAVYTDSADLEVLPSAVIEINGIWCIQFVTTSCSPFAFVIYKENMMDVSSEAAAGAGGFAGAFNTGVFLFTALPDIMPQEKKTKFVVSAKKYYRIKK